MTKEYLNPGVTLEDLNSPEVKIERGGHYSEFIGRGCLSGNRSDDKQVFISYVRRNHKRGDTPYFKELDLKARVTFHYNGGCNYDIDNLLKTLFDSLQGIAYKNDAMIKEVYAKIDECSLIEGVTVDISPYRNF